MEVLMVAPEMVPYAKTGGLADVAGALSLALAELGVKVSAVMPLYRGIEQKFQPEPAWLKLKVPLLVGEDLEEKEGEILHTRLEDKVDVYFVKMDEYFNRTALYTEKGEDYADNSARFTFFSRAVMELIRSGKVRPQVIHCHDWQAALTPIYLERLYRDDPALAGTRSVFTIHNLGYQGIFWHWDMKLMGLPWELFNIDFLEYFGKVNLLKGAILSADAITTVSESYAREIMTPELGYGLDGVLQGRADRLFGIVNGIDYNIWDPRVDATLPARFRPDDLAGKAACKAQLQREFNLPLRPDVPLVASISRLVDQKGYDLIAAILGPLMKEDLQLVVLGTGAREYEDLFTALAQKHPDRVGVKIGFDDRLAHLIEAGADLFLMPSMYEPCGLNQMISLRYGAVPLVRATGGLNDTINPFDPATGAGNGFKFTAYTPAALQACLTDALALYRNRAAWRALVRNGMEEDHSWTASARRYLEVYQKAIAPE
jgi:starch synthase